MQNHIISSDIKDTLILIAQWPQAKSLALPVSNITGQASHAPVRALAAVRYASVSPFPTKVGPSLEASTRRPS